MLKTEIPALVPNIWTTIAKLRINRVDALAPKMQTYVAACLAECRTVGLVNGQLFDPIVFETIRTDALQRIYFNQGTTKAPTAIYGWHFYGLAVDVISASREWSVTPAWWTKLAEIMERHGLDAGHRWTRPDDPHGQFGTVKGSPSDLARTLYFGTPHWQTLSTYDGAAHTAGLRRVWEDVGAL